MEQKTIVSKQGELSGRDWLKGTGLSLLVAILFAILDFVQKWIASGKTIFDLNWQDVAQAAVAGLVAYLIKNLIEPSKIVTVQKLKKNDQIDNEI